MSVSTMRKLSVFAPKDQADALIHRLMRLRCVQVRQVEGAGRLLSRVDCDAQRAALEARVSMIAQALDTLAKYSERKGFVQTPKQLDTEKFKAERYNAAMQATEQTLALARCESECRAELAALQQHLHVLSPWLTLGVPLELDSTRHCELLLGCFPAKTQLKVVADALEPYCAQLESVFSDDDGEYVTVVYHKADATAVQRVLGEKGFVKAPLKEFSRLPREEYQTCKQACEKAEAELGRIKQQFFELARMLDDIEMLWDVENSELTVAIAKQKLAETDYLVLLEGWAPQSRADKIAEVLSAAECAFELEEPAEGEEPPVLLRNNRFAQNFEWVVGMYSYPKYGTYDPTFIMSIYYFVIFGLMFADVGYGLLLILGAFLGVKFMKLSPGMKRMFTMFGYCGIACVILGAVFGGWFGDLPYAIMTTYMGYESAEAAKAAAPIFNGVTLTLNGEPLSLNPLENPIPFLIISLAMGLIHILGGMAVKFYLLCREGKIFSAIFDIGSYWILFGGIGLIFVDSTVGLAVTVMGVLMIVLTQGREKKNIFAKLVFGLKGLYDLISYASDLLSYSRILALGLAAGVMAQVFNLLGTLGGPTIPGFILLILVMLIGHGLNMAINILGAFVHTCRLQYLEFFSRFYEDGGTPFDPALPSEKYSTAESEKTKNKTNSYHKGVIS